MTMELRLLPCPICLRPHFSNVEILRSALISVATSDLSCPVCSEILRGLDKLTIHLFVHTSVHPNKTQSLVLQSAEDQLRRTDNFLEKETNKNVSEGSVDNLNVDDITVAQVTASMSETTTIGVSRNNNLILAEDVQTGEGQREERNVLPRRKSGRDLDVPEIQNEIYRMNVEVEDAGVEVNIDTLKDKPEQSVVVICDICNFPFNDETILELHQKLLHQTSPDTVTGKYSYHCHLCSKKFKMRGSLMVHLRVAHFGFVHHQTKKERQLENKPQERERSSIDLVSHKIFSSENIKLVRGKQEDPIVKVVKQGGGSVETSNRTVAIDNDSGGNGTNNCNKQWACDVCTKMFTTKYFLKKHKRLHTGEMPYFCAQCNKYFTFQQSYHKHMLYHSDDKPHVCTECGRAFKELSTLHNHARIHSGERPFACETCGKCFRQRVSYLVHRRIHTGAMPYKCTACNKSFRYKVSQRSHKCSADPPGSVIRTTDLIRKLLQHDESTNKFPSKTTPPTENDSALLNQDLNRKGTDLCIVNTTAGNAVNLRDEIASMDKGNSEQALVSGAENFSHGQDEMLGTTKPEFGTQEENLERTHNNQHINENSEQRPSTNLQHTGTGTDTEFLSFVLSPLFPVVQDLNSTSSEERYVNEGNFSNPRRIPSDGSCLQTINEESLKELLYGTKS